MAKQSGLGWAVTVTDSGGVARTVTNDITDVQINTPSAVQDITGLDKSAIERLLLLADASGSLKGVFNTAAAMSHAVLKNYRTEPAAGWRIIVFTPTGAVSTLTLNVHFTDYQQARSQDGKHIWTAPFVLADGSVPTWT